MSWDPPTVEHPEKPTPLQVLRRYKWVVIGTLLAGGIFAWSAANDDGEPRSRGFIMRIDQMAFDGDCSGLRFAFDTADGDRERNYIDDALDDAGCYD